MLLKGQQLSRISVKKVMLTFKYEQNLLVKCPAPMLDNKYVMINIKNDGQVIFTELCVVLKIVCYDNGCQV